MSNKNLTIFAIIILVLLALLKFEDKEKKIAYIDTEVLKREFIYSVASSKEVSEEDLQNSVHMFSEDFKKFKIKVEKIAQEKGYIVLSKNAVLGGGEDITPQAVRLLKDIRK